ncbi:hypothetical protein ATE92_0559 [Ulvibacter sp. MAR_2010_11]|nr:hypothetical protein ATE92_0559 [Ulvibacter sp. MAR_2010_11]
MPTRKLIEINRFKKIENVTIANKKNQQLHFLTEIWEFFKLKNNCIAKGSI